MTPELEQLKSELLARYPASEWPCLLEQIEAPLQVLRGLRVLDSTPLFTNTLAKHLGLLAAGVELIVPAEPPIGGDPAALERLRALGVPVLSPQELEGAQLDIILDCAGHHAHLSPRLGFVELTRSGVARFESSSVPVVVADSSVIKRLETVLGTGDGFLRALEQLGYGDMAGKTLLLVGGGKVGQGIDHAARARGMRVSVVDFDAPEWLGESAFVQVESREELQAAAEHADFLVTATGHKNALHGRLDMVRLAASPVIIANMGVEDEFGADLPDTRVLNGKKPLNFILNDPTSMRFIETTMALHSACAVELVKQKLTAGMHEAPKDLVQQLLARLLAVGTFTPQELKAAGII